ncbi:unnamed protein product [Caretta caretta]
MLSDSWEGVNANIQILKSFCKLSGLKVQASKCHGFLLSPTHDSFTVNNCEAWKISCNGLNMIAPGESQKYLGLKFDPWIGFTKPALSDKLDTWLERINRAPLKPSQKLEMLNTFTVPRVISLADHTDCQIPNRCKLAMELQLCSREITALELNGEAVEGSNSHHNSSLQHIFL